MAAREDKPEDIVFKTVPTKRLTKLREVMAGLDALELQRMYNRMRQNPALRYLKGHVSAEITARQVPLPFD